LSGPYLAADIYKRYLAQAGRGAAHYVVSTDDNQSYVDTTAARLGVSPDSLITTSRAAIQNTLQAYNIGVTHFGAQDEEYDAFVISYFQTLLMRDEIQVRQQPVLFDKRSSQYPVEAFVTGICPNCLDATCGGICETCGHPNQCIDLLGLNKDQYEILVEPRLVLDLEKYRPELDEYLLAMTSHRPALLRLITALLSRPLAPFVLSYKTDRGISAAFAGLPDQTLNAWGEMYPGHICFLQRSAGPLSGDDEYIQFLGFDNSYFYVCAHSAMAIAARRNGFNWPIPRAFLTNQFYYLDSYKFSTSKGHAVWASELAKQFNPDIIRLFLALHGPEYQEANFVTGAFTRTATMLAASINRVVDAYNSMRQAHPPPQKYPNEIAAVMGRPLELSGYSSAQLASRCLNCLHYIHHLLSSGDRTFLTYVPGLVSLCLEVFCPVYADALKRRLDMTANTWQAIVASSPHVALPTFEVAR
jgi:methionyl-tRNA synthetase